MAVVDNATLLGAAAATAVLGAVSGIVAVGHPAFSGGFVSAVTLAVAIILAALVLATRGPLAWRALAVLAVPAGIACIVLTAAGRGAAATVPCGVLLVVGLVTCWGVRTGLVRFPAAGEGQS